MANITDTSNESSSIDWRTPTDTYELPIFGQYQGPPPSALRRFMSFIRRKFRLCVVEIEEKPLFDGVSFEEYKRCRIRERWLFLISLLTCLAAFSLFIAVLIRRY